MKKKILIVDDEEDIIQLLDYNLKREGYETLISYNGKEALELADLKPDLILLDIMIPEIDGLEVIKRLKQNKSTSNIPVIFLTAKGTEFDEVVGLELGAVDYIIKPISIPKLLARIRNVFRKVEAVSDLGKQKIQIGKIEIFPESYIIKIEGKEVYFPNKEFQLLLYLALNQGKVITRETLLKAVWGEDVFVVDRTVDVHIRKIREKLGKYADYIETIKNVGYKLREI